MKGLEVVEWEKHLNIKARTSEHNLSYNRESFNSKRSNDYAFFERDVGERHYFFINRVTPNWNMLPSNVINSSSLNGSR